MEAFVFPVDDPFTNLLHTPLETVGIDRSYSLTQLTIYPSPLKAAMNFLNIRLQMKAASIFTLLAETITA